MPHLVMRKLVRKIAADVLPILNNDLVGLIETVAESINQWKLLPERRGKISVPQIKRAYRELINIRRWQDADPAILGYIYEALIETVPDRSISRDTASAAHIEYGALQASVDISTSRAAGHSTGLIEGSGNSSKNRLHGRYDSHSSGTLLMLQSSLAPFATSQVSGMSLILQSAMIGVSFV